MLHIVLYTIYNHVFRRELEQESITRRASRRQTLHKYRPWSDCSYSHIVFYSVFSVTPDRIHICLLFYM